MVQVLLVVLVLCYSEAALSHSNEDVTAHKDRDLGAKNYVTKRLENKFRRHIQIGHIISGNLPGIHVPLHNAFQPSHVGINVPVYPQINAKYDTVHSNFGNDQYIAGTAWISSNIPNGLSVAKNLQNVVLNTMNQQLNSIQAMHRQLNMNTQNLLPLPGLFNLNGNPNIAQQQGYPNNNYGQGNFDDKVHVQKPSTFNNHELNGKKQNQNAKSPNVDPSGSTKAEEEDFDIDIRFGEERSQ